MLVAAVVAAMLVLSCLVFDLDKGECLLMFVDVLTVCMAGYDSDYYDYYSIHYVI
jgi:hypothetical protein